MPRLLVPTATTSPRLMGCPHAESEARVVAGISATCGRANVWRTRTMRGVVVMEVVYAVAPGNVNAGPARLRAGPGGSGRPDGRRLVGGGAWGEAPRRSPIQIILTWCAERPPKARTTTHGC